MRPPDEDTHLRCRLLYLLALIGLGGPGCSPIHTLALPAEPAHMRPNHKDKDGLTVAAFLLSTPQTIAYHFGADLGTEGYFPIFVFFENRGTSSFEIEREDFAVVLENGERFEPVSPREVLATMRQSHSPAFALAPLILPAILLYRAIEEHNFAAAKTIYEKAFPASRRLEKGDTHYVRAVFFRDPALKKRPPKSFEGSVLQVVVEVEGSRPKDEPENEASKPEVGSQATTSPDRSPVVGRLLTFTVSLSEGEP